MPQLVAESSVGLLPDSANAPVGPDRLLTLQSRPPMCCSTRLHIID